MKNEELNLRRCVLLIVLTCSFFILHSSFFILHCFAQSGGNYYFYRYLQTRAVEVDPLGAILGRISAHYEQRLDPNFTRTYEFVWQRELGDKLIYGYHRSEERRV